MIRDDQFLADLEARITEPWTNDETLRLWQLSGYRIPPAVVRTTYSQGVIRRREIIDRIHTRTVERVMLRLEE